MEIGTIGRKIIMPKKKEKTIKAWAVIFPKSQDIYETIIYPLGVRQVKAIFSDRNDAKWWKDKYCGKETYEPKIVRIEIKILK